MKFSIDATDFHQALKSAQSVVDAKPVRPIYECVKIDADGAGITVTGGNSEQQISTYVEAAVEEEGSVAVPLKVLIGYIGMMSEDVKVKSDSVGNISLKSGTFKADIAGQDVDNYTVLSINPEVQFTADAAKFSDAISSVVFAASTDQSYNKRIICSVHVEVDEGGQGVAVAISDILFARRFFSVNMLSEDPVAINIPSAMVKPLCTALQGQEDFALCFDNHVVMVTAGNRTFIFPEVAGEYFNYRHILDFVQPDKFAKVDAQSLLNAIRFSIVSCKDGKEFRSKLLFNGSEQQMTIRTKSATAHSDTDIGIEYAGEDLAITFDIRSLQDIVNFCIESGADDLEIALMAPGRVAAVRPLNGNDEYYGLITPARTVD